MWGGSATLHYIFLTESILGERSRTVARIKRENFHRGVSCIEPFGEQRESTSQARVVSWEDTKKTEEQAFNRKLNNAKAETNKTAPQKDAGDADKKSRRTELEKLREMISIRRGSIDQKTVDQSAAGPGVKGSGLKAEEESKSSDREKTEARGRAGVKMTDGPRPRPLLQRGSSCNPQQALKTSERPPLSRGFSVQARRNPPAITITRPHSTIEDGHHRPKIDILEAVSEIHDNFKDNTRAYEEDFTEEETEEDEFHEQLQGDPCDPHKTQLTKNGEWDDTKTTYISNHRDRQVVKNMIL